MSLEVTKQELLKQAIYLNKLYATTRNQEYKDQETRIRRIIVELDILIIGGIVSLNGLTAATQTFTNDTNVTIVSSGTAHAITWAGTLADARITSATNWNTAYTNRITSLTTIGSSGAATLVSNVLNIPNYTLSGLGGVATTRTLTINGTTYDLSADRTWTISTATPTLDQVTTAGNTTTNAINTGLITTTTSAVGNMFVANGTNSTYLTLANDSSGRMVIEVKGTQVGPIYTGGAYFSANGFQESFFNIIARGANTGNRYWRFGNYTDVVSGLFAIQKLNDAGTSITSTPFLIFSNTSNIIIGASTATPTDAGYKLDVNGTARVSGNLTVDTDTLFVDSVNNRVGIGTATPLTTLEVRTSSNSAITSLASVPNAATTLLIGNTGTNGVLAIGHDNAGHPWLQGRSVLAGQSPEDILINPLGGNVGIGTTTPTAKLTVTGSITAASLLAQGVYFNNTLVAAANNDVLVGLDINPTFTNGAFTGVQNIALRTQTGNVNLSGVLTVDYANYKVIIGSGLTIKDDYTYNYSWIGTTISRPLYFYTNNNDVARFTTGGNFIIGTSTPADAGYKFDVNGTARVSGNTSISAGNLSIFTTNTPRRINVQSASGGQCSILGMYDGGGSLQAAFGIETVSTNALQMASTSAIRFYAGSVIGNAATEPTNERMRLFSNGNLAIGTTTDAGFKLDVNGTARVKGTGTTSATTSFLVQNSAGDQIGSFRDDGQVVIGKTAGAYIIAGNLSNFYNTSAGYGHVFRVAGTEVVRIEGTGNVGIGTAAPTAKLQVAGSITAASLIAQGVFFNNTLVAAANSDVLVGLDINPTFTNGAFTGVTNVALRTNGLVVLGTSAYTYGSTYTSGAKLTIENTGGYNGLAINNGAGSYQFSIKTTTSDNIGIQFYWSDGNTNSFFQHANNLGTIVGQINTPVTLKGSYTALGYAIGYGYNEGMRVAATTGNILINTTTDAGYKLDVNGTARLNGQTTLTSITANTTINTSNNGNVILNVANFALQLQSTNPNSGSGTLITTGDITKTDSQTKNIININNSVSSTAANFVFLNGFAFTSTINQTLGTIRGLYIAPTLTAATDFRAIETTAGKVIFNGGNVGIGTSTPATALEVSGNIKLSATGQQLQDFNGNNLIRNSAGTLTVGNAAININMALTVGTGGATVNIPNGNVLIGTTTDAGQKLQVIGSVFIKGTDSLSSTKVFEVQNGAGASIMDFRNATYAFFGCGQGGGSNSGFIFNYSNTSYTQFAGYNYGAGSGAYKPILMDTDTGGRNQGIFVNFGTVTLTPPNSDTEFAVLGRTSDSTTYISRFRNSTNLDKFEIRADGALFTNTLQGYSGTLSIPGNPPGSTTITITNGLITNIA